MKAEVSDVVDVLQLPLNSQVYELLTLLMDWISDQHLSKIKIQEEREDTHKFMATQTSKKSCTQERCMKVKGFGLFACVNKFSDLWGVLNDFETITDQPVLYMLWMQSLKQNHC